MLTCQAIKARSLNRATNISTRFVVPTNNLGFVRVSLETSSGNPDAYVRFGSAPTVLHNSGGGAGTLYDRGMIATNTEYANWVPVDGKLESVLQPGTWYLMVRANGNANARYRLRVSSGDIQNVNIAGDSLTNQTLARRRLALLPHANAYESAARMACHLQPTVWRRLDVYPRHLSARPGAHGGEIQRLGYRYKKQRPVRELDPAGTYSFSAPATRPGQVYYVGFRAVSDATFSMSVATNGGPTLEPQTINFYGGSITTNLPPFSQVTYRIDVPPKPRGGNIPRRIAPISSSSSSRGPFRINPLTTTFRSSGTNSALNQYLLTAWPWVPNQPYFLTVSNVSAGIEPLTFTMDGRNRPPTTTTPTFCRTPGNSPISVT